MQTPPIPKLILKQAVWSILESISLSKEVITAIVFTAYSTEKAAKGNFVTVTTSQPF